MDALSEYKSFALLRKASIAFASSMQEKSRWDMYERTLWFMQQYCLDDEADAAALEEAVEAFVALRREYLTTQMQMRERPLYETAVNRAFAEEYSKTRKSFANQ
jgi:hypothetical protein